MPVAVVELISGWNESKAWVEKGIWPALYSSLLNAAMSRGDMFLTSYFRAIAVVNESDALSFPESAFAGEDFDPEENMLLMALMPCNTLNGDITIRFPLSCRRVFCLEFNSKGNANYNILKNKHL